MSHESYNKIYLYNKQLFIKLQKFPSPTTPALTVYRTQIKTIIYLVALILNHNFKRTQNKGK